MKRKWSLLCIVILMALLCTCCTQVFAKELYAPARASQYIGRYYLAVLEEFEEAGFTNITMRGKGNLILGILKKEGSVASVSINGNIEYNANKAYPSDVAIVITYNSQYVEEWKGNDRAKDNAKTSPQRTEKSAPMEELEVIKLESNQDFLTIVEAKSPKDAVHGIFAEKYAGYPILFDAYIVDKATHADYKTRYDIFFLAGDYPGEGKMNTGPVFLFEDVGISDLGLRGLELPLFIQQGSNVRIHAYVDRFDEEAGFFYLKPILLEDRSK